MPEHTTHIYDDVGTFHFFEQYIIGEPNAETEMVTDTAKPLIDDIKEHYQTPFFYIGNRINRNSVDPISVAQAIAGLPLLIGVGVVCHHPSTRLVVEVEKKFISSLPYHTFTTVDEAVDWGLRTLNERKQ